MKKLLFSLFFIIATTSAQATPELSDKSDRRVKRLSDRAQTDYRYSPAGLVSIKIDSSIYDRLRKSFNGGVLQFRIKRLTPCTDSLGGEGKCTPELLCHLDEDSQTAICPLTQFSSKNNDYLWVIRDNDEPFYLVAELKYNRMITQEEKIETLDKGNAITITALIQKLLNQKMNQALSLPSKPALPNSNNP